MKKWFYFTNHKDIGLFEFTYMMLFQMLYLLSKLFIWMELSSVGELLIEFKTYKIMTILWKYM